eukprot:2586993-Amphidinium_carterae.1
MKQTDGREHETLPEKFTTKTQNYTDWKRYDYMSACYDLTRSWQSAIQNYSTTISRLAARQTIHAEDYGATTE